MTNEENVKFVRQLHAAVVKHAKTFGYRPADVKLQPDANQPSQIHIARSLKEEKIEELYSLLPSHPELLASITTRGGRNAITIIETTPNSKPGLPPTFRQLQNERNPRGWRWKKGTGKRE